MQIIDRRAEGGNIETSCVGKCSNAVLCTCLGNHDEIMLTLDVSGNLVAEFASGLTEKGTVEMIALEIAAL